MAALPPWQATGLSLAVIATDAYTGSGALLFALVSACFIWALHRLHAYAPLSRSMADLIASAPGAVPARPVAVIQFAAYVLMGAFVAKGIGLLALTWSVADPVAAADGWLWPALTVAAVAVAAAVVGALPTRLLAPVVTVLAAFGLLVYFYVALAVAARVVSGTAPVEIGPPAASFEWGPAALVIGLAASLSDSRSRRRPVIG